MAASIVHHLIGLDSLLQTPERETTVCRGKALRHNNLELIGKRCGAGNAIVPPSNVRVRGHSGRNSKKATICC